MMIEQTHRYLNRTADLLCRYAHFVKEPGLLNGKMGIALFLYRCQRVVDNQEYAQIAGEFVDDVFNRLSLEDSPDIDTGLCGIGYGVDYLIKNNYVDADSDEILEDLDNHIASAKGDLSAASYWLKRGNRELFDKTIAQSTRSLTRAMNKVKAGEIEASRAVLPYDILKLLLFYVGNDMTPGDNVRKLYDFMVESNPMPIPRWRTMWSSRPVLRSDLYILERVHDLFGHSGDISDPKGPAGVSAEGLEMRLADLINFRDYNLKYGLQVPVETHTKITDILNDDDLLDEWINLAMPATMHISGHMTGFGWILLDWLDAQGRA